MKTADILKWLQREWNRATRRVQEIGEVPPQNEEYIRLRSRIEVLEDVTKLIKASMAPQDRLVRAKIYGVERSGTNWLHLLLESNYFVDLITSVDSGSKHEPYKQTYEPAHIIVTVKHPLAWLLSMVKFRFRRDGLNVGQIMEPELERWHEFYRCFLSLRIPNKHNMLVRYEDLLEDPRGQCGQIASRIKAERKPGDFYIPYNKMKKNNTEGTKNFDKAYYVNQRYLEEYSQEDLDRVRSLLNWQLVESLGYQRF